MFLLLSAPSPSPVPSHRLQTYLAVSLLLLPVRFFFIPVLFSCLLAPPLPADELPSSSRQLLLSRPLVRKGPILAALCVDCQTLAFPASSTPSLIDRCRSHSTHRPAPLALAAALSVRTRARFRWCPIPPKSRPQQPGFWCKIATGRARRQQQHCQQQQQQQQSFCFDSCLLAQQHHLHHHNAPPPARTSCPFW